MADIRVAVVGYGLAGQVFHVPLIAGQPGLRVVTVVTANPERQRQVHDRWPGVRILDRADRLWDKAREHDLVVLATPPETHLPLGLAALDQGLALVVDKPVAPDVAGARALAVRAAERGVPYTVFQNRRWDADQRTLRRLVREGALGEIVRYESRLERWRPRRQEDRWRDLTPADRGGGALHDLGSHLVDQATWHFGAAEVAYAEVRAWRGGPSDDEVFVALRHAGGVRSHLSTGAVFAAPGPRLRVLGTEAAFVVPEPDRQEEQLRAGLRPEHAAYGVEADGWGWLGRGDRWEPVVPERGDWPAFYAQVHAALTGDGEVPVDPWDAVETTRLLAAARELAAATVTDPDPARPAGGA